MNANDALSVNELYPHDDEDPDDYIDGSCLECGAGPDEVCDCDTDDNND